MSVIIRYRDKFILKCQNALFCALYWDILDYIEEKNIELNNELSDIIDSLQTGCDGIGLDISNYLTIQNNMIIFTQLIRNALDKRYKESPNMPEKIKEIYEKFYEELLKACKEFPEK